MDFSREAQSSWLTTDRDLLESHQGCHFIGHAKIPMGRHLISPDLFPHLDDKFSRYPPLCFMAGNESSCCRPNPMLRLLPTQFFFCKKTELTTNFSLILKTNLVHKNYSTNCEWDKQFHLQNSLYLHNFSSSFKQKFV